MSELDQQYHCDPRDEHAELLARLVREYHAGAEAFDRTLPGVMWRDDTWQPYPEWMRRSTQHALALIVRLERENGLAPGTLKRAICAPRLPAG